MVSFDATAPVTPAAQWAANPNWSTVRGLEPAAIGDDVVIFAAHPDDETLGAGALIAALADRGARIHVVFATAGHDDSSTATRRREATTALGGLAPGATLEFLGLPDAGLKDNTERLGALVAEVLGSRRGATALVTWAGDRHGDHRRLAEAVLRAAPDAAVTVLEYPIWLWQWGVGDDVPWQRLRTIAASPQQRARKAAALGAYASQITGADPVLVPSFLEHFALLPEVLLVPEEPEEPDERASSESHFDELHRAADPWGFETRWYERRKRAVTLAALPQQRYRSTLEVGCSTGVLTAELAGRADAVLGVDISPVAVAAAQRRLAGVPAARAQVLDIRSGWPDGEFDLVVLSEIGYYLDAASWAESARLVAERIIPGGTVLLCHWLQREDDFQQDTRALHRLFETASGLRRVIEHVDEEFLLEVFTTAPGAAPDPPRPPGH
jgi:LmbE family N-acetylglucosaminyl deacetylase